MLGRAGNWTTPLQRPLSAATIAVAAWFRGVVTAVRYPGRAAELDATVAQLRAREAALLAEAQRRDELLRAVEAPTTLLDLPYAAHPARVIAGTFTPASMRLTITTDGAPLTSGDPVLAQGALIGTIADAGTRRAVVRLLRDPAQRIGAARASDTAAVIGVVEQRAGGGLALTHVPIDVEIAEGDAVVTAATDERIPSGIPIGTLADVRVESDGFFQSATVIPATDPRDAAFVITLTPL